MTKFFLPNGPFIKHSILSGGNAQPPASIPVTRMMNALNWKTYNPVSKPFPAFLWEVVANALLTEDGSYFRLESGERLLIHA